MPKDIGKEAKLFAKGLYLVVDAGGKRKYSFEHIAKQIKVVFGEQIAPATVSRWSEPWQKQIDEARILATQAAAVSLVDHEEDITPDKGTLNVLEKVQKCIKTQLQLGIVSNTKRFKAYLGKESRLLEIISTPSKKLTDDDKDELLRFSKYLNIRDIQAGIKQSNDIYFSYVEQLLKLDNLKNQRNIINAEVTSIRDDVWEYDPVDILTFMEDEEYLNLGPALFNVVKADLKEIFYGTPRTMKRRYREVIMKGSVGCGKSEAAAIISSYLAYLCLCLRDPCSYFNFLPGSKIAIINISVNTKQAKHVVFGKIKAKIDNCKWFRDNYMYDTRSKLELRFDPSDSTQVTKNRIYKNVYIIPGNSSEYSAVGYDIICAIIDEATLYPKVDDKDQAETIFGVLKERVISRFNDKGLIVMMGNPMHTEDFLEKHIKAAAFEPGTYCVAERSIWDAKYPNWDGEVFYFDRHKLIEVKEDKKHMPSVLTIPKIYHENFKANPEQSARGLGGWSLESISRFFKNSENIDAMFTKSINPVKEVDEISCKVTFHDWFKPVSKGWHTIHIDLGHTSDAVGIGLGHIQDYKEGKPFFATDAMIRIKGTKTDPIIFEKIRKIIYQIQDLGFQVKCITLDGFQSTDMIQILRAKGFTAELLSVDKTVLPYGNLKNAINEHRVSCPYDAILDREVRNLEDIDGKKIDHPFRGSKDLSDALCGWINCAMEYIPPSSVVLPSSKSLEVKDDKNARTPDAVFQDQLNKMAG